MRVILYYVNRISFVLALSLIVPSLAWADFFNYARYLKLQVVPEVRLIKDAYRNISNPTEASILALNKLLVVNENVSNSLASFTQVKVQASLNLASLYFEQRKTSKAKELLNQVQLIIKDTGDDKLQLYFLYQSGMIALSNQKYGRARSFYISALSLSSRLNNLLMLALARQALGEVQLLSGDTSSALNNFKSAYIGLQNLNQVVLAADAGILYFALLSKRGDINFEKIDMPELIDLIRLNPDDDKRLQQTSELLETFNSLRLSTVPANINEIFRQLADESVRLTRKPEVGKNQLLVMRNLLALYVSDGQYVAALKLVQDALSENISAAPNEETILLYLDQARLLRLTNQGKDSIAVYQATLPLLKTSLFNDVQLEKKKWANRIVAAYDELIALQFEKQHSLVSDDSMRQNLTELRDSLEQRNYFYFHSLLDNGFNDFAAAQNSVPILSRKAAVIYPVLFDDRLEMLISLPQGLKLVTQQIKKHRLLQVVAQLRKAIEQPDKKSAYKKSAMTLYQWLITPYKQQLLRQNVSSLVFVLDKALALLPTSALFDKKGRRYLVEQYAIAVSPGLMLTDVNVHRRKRGGVLFLGLTSSTDQFDAAQLIKQEINNIAATTPVSVHVDDSFSDNSISNIMDTVDYNKIHISAPFSIEPQFNNSYVMSHDQKLSLVPMLAVLKQQRQLELVVLSGNTAMSQRRRSDGGILAIANSFGSRSAVASLWPRASDATPLFMAEFYTILSSSSMSISTAVRRAKIRLISSKHYQHPAYWARFELFGNWL